MTAAFWVAKAPVRHSFAQELKPSMPAWSVEEVQRIVLTTVNYSPVVLVALLVSWSFLAYDFSLCGGLLKDDHVLRGKLASSYFPTTFDCRT